jgi:hypothetical protein
MRPVPVILMVASALSLLLVPADAAGAASATSPTCPGSLHQVGLVVSGYSITKSHVRSYSIGSGQFFTPNCASISIDAKVNLLGTTYTYSSGGSPFSNSQTYSFYAPNSSGAYGNPAGAQGVFCSRTPANPALPCALANV